MERANTWERELDDWVVRTDMSTILLEHAADYLVRSEDGGDALASSMAYGEFLGATHAIAVLAMVPVEVVWERVRCMAGVGEVA